MKSIKTISYAALSIALSIALTFQCFFSMAQAPEKVSYQSVIRDATGELVRSQTVGVQISILQGAVDGSEVYVETQTPTTNINGLATMEVGNGNLVSGTFSAIDWSNSPYFLKVDTDPTGGTVYSMSGTSEILSTPYALYAKTAGSISDNAVDGTDISLAAEVDGDMMTFDGTNWVAKNIFVESSGVSQTVDNMQPYLAVNYIIALDGRYPSRNSISDPTIAEITMFGGNFPPRYWAFCNGQLLPIAQNESLYSLLSDYYGGDRRTTFALPDLRGRVAIHAGNGPGLPSYSLGQKGGVSEVQLPAHTHTIIYQ